MTNWDRFPNCYEYHISDLSHNVVHVYCNVTFCHPLSNSQACIWLWPSRVALTFLMILTLASDVVLVNQILIFCRTVWIFKLHSAIWHLDSIFPTSCPLLKFSPQKMFQKKIGHKFVYCVAMVTYYIVIIYIYMCVSISQVLIWGQLSYFHSCFVCSVYVCVLMISVVCVYICKVETVVTSCILI